MYAIVTKVIFPPEEPDRVKPRHLTRAVLEPGLFDRESYPRKLGLKLYSVSIRGGISRLLIKR